MSYAEVAWKDILFVSELVGLAVGIRLSLIT
jgi:hypothetical protein